MQGYGSKSTRQLFEAIANMHDAEECRAFFEDLCTIKEIQDMAQRLDTALLLDKGLSYREISGAVGISSATISRVSNCLTYGSGGYRLAIDRMAETENKDGN